MRKIVVTTTLVCMQSPERPEFSPCNFFFNEIVKDSNGMSNLIKVAQFQKKISIWLKSQKSAQFSPELKKNDTQEHFDLKIKSCSGLKTTTASKRNIGSK